MEQHLGQLHTLYSKISRYKTIYNNSGVINFLAVFGEKISALTGESESIPNPLYPDEGYEEFLSRMIMEKKKRIERLICLSALISKPCNQLRLIGILSVVLISVIGGLIYVSNGSSVRERAVIEYLENRGYSQSQIQSVQANFSLLSAIFSYPAWGVEVVFADEQNVKYGYRYDSETGVSQGGVSGGDKKEDLKHVEK